MVGGMKRLLTTVALLGLFALSACAVTVEEDRRFPTSKDFPPTVMRHGSFTAGGTHPWRLATLETPRPNAPWKVVVVTGTPSWSEFWAPTLAALPERYTMVVADRPGFAASEPKTLVGSISDQADALAPMLETAPGQKVILVGQSYGAPIASLMAARHPDKVAALILMSPFFGARGAEARKLMTAGGFVRWVLPHDLKNGYAEVKGQAPQLPAARAALAGVTAPVLVLQGDADTFVLAEDARRLTAVAAASPAAVYVTVPKGDHFLNACCVPALIGALDRAVELTGRK